MSQCHIDPSETPVGPWADGPTFPCPGCGAPLDAHRADPVDGSVTCTCGRRAYAGYIAEAAAIEARLGWLRDRIAGGDAAPTPELAQRYAVWGPPTVGPPPVAHRALDVQTLLLTLGASLVIAAAIVFAAVMWRHLGVAGQVLLFAGLTLAVGSFAAWLHPRLERTAEALGVVAFGLLVVDAVAAPKLGLLPSSWFVRAHPYLVITMAIVAVVALLAGHNARMVTWIWLGWGSVAASFGLLAWWVGDGVAGTASQRAAALSLAMVPGVAVFAWSWKAPTDREPARCSGAATVVIALPFLLRYVFQERSVPGALVATILTTAALGAAWWKLRREPLDTGAAIGVGFAAAAAFLLPHDRQVAWLGLVVALAGALVIVVLARRRRWPAGVLAAVVLWTVWLGGRIARIGAAPTETERTAIATLVRHQAAWLTLVAALVGFSVAWHRNGEERAALLAWPAAVIGEIGLLLASPSWAPHVLESGTLSFATLLLVAGFIGTREPTHGSTLRFGPALTVALVPSALATWGAAWVDHSPAHGARTEDLVRLVVVLAAGATLAILGAERHRIGVLAPAAAAVTIAGAAQVWSGLSAMPRWIALALAGVVLVLAGARLEWLRREGHRVRTWFGHLT